MNLLNLLKHSQSLLSKIALTTAIAVFHIQIIPASAMQKESIEEEQEPLIHKIGPVLISPASQHHNIIDDYVDRLNRVSTQQEANGIIENIHPPLQEEVFRRLDEKARGSSSSCMDIEDEQTESSKRKRVEEKLTRTSRKRKKSRTEKKEEVNIGSLDSSLFLGLPVEIQSLIASFIKERKSIANYRKACRQMKAVMDESYHFPLQRCTALTKRPRSFTGKKYRLSGWAQDLMAIFPLLSTDRHNIYGDIFVRNQEDILQHFPNLDSITLTGANDEQAKSKNDELINQGLSKLRVRSREALWQKFIEKDHRDKSSIINGKNSLSFLLDIDDDGALAKKILSCYSVALVIKVFNEIPDGLQRPHVASLLNEKIFSLCQTGTQFEQVIKALVKIPIDEPRKLILLSNKIVGKCRNGSELSKVIAAGAHLPTAKFDRIILFLDTPNQRSRNSDPGKHKILAKCQDGNQLSEVITACANIPEARYKSIISLVGTLKFLKKCEDGSRLSKVIEASTHIPDEETRKDVIKVIGEKTLDASPDGDRIKVIMNALARIEVGVRGNVAQLIAMQNFDGCKSDDQHQTNDKSQGYIEGLATVSDWNIRGDISTYLDKQTLEKCEDGSQVKEVVKALENVGDKEKIRRICNLINYQICRGKCQDGSQVAAVIEAFSKIPDIQKENVWRQVGKLLNQKIEKFKDGN